MTNRTVKPGREPVFFLPPSVVVLAALCVVLWALQTYALNAQQTALLVWRGAFIPARYGPAGPPADLYFFTSPLTYSLLHAGFSHLAINMIWLAAFGAPLAQRIGSLRFYLFWMATALGAAALHFSIHSTDMSPLVGASGAISGMMGAAARFAFRTKDTGGARAFSGPPLPLADALTNRAVFMFIAVWMVINLLSGLGFVVPGGASANIAWEAHIGGFLVGFLALRAFDR